MVAGQVLTYFWKSNLHRLELDKLELDKSSLSCRDRRGAKKSSSMTLYTVCGTAKFARRVEGVEDTFLYGLLGLATRSKDRGER